MPLRADELMKCPFCKEDRDKVVDSRSSNGGAEVRRRRICLKCRRRFTTYERPEKTSLRVIKKDGNREPFDRQKIYGGILKACEKRPVPMQKIEDTVNIVELELFNDYEREVESRTIGDMVMRHLKDLDQVAYVRFASVYRDFKDISEFENAVRPLLQEAEKLRRLSNNKGKRRAIAKN